MANLSSQELLRAYEDGQDDAATEIFDRYVERLLALIRKRIGPKLQRRVDAEDVAQSAYRSFFVHAKDGDYQLGQSGDLWRLLASIALNKLHRQIEKHTAAKRSIDREEPVDTPIDNLAIPEPTAAEAVAVFEGLQIALAQLSDDERLVVSASLQGRSLAEIGVEIDKSERTVRRLLADGKRKVQQYILDGPALESKEPLRRVDPHAPLRYSDYTLERLLGAGGMGKVFRANEKSTGNVVAFKALHKSRLSDERAVARFVQEAEILAPLRHPNIVGVNGLGRFPSGGYFIVMDYIDGKDLQSILRQGPMQLEQVKRIMVQVADGVQHAHSQGIIHCDLKPANILLEARDHAIVTDFGFAYMIAGVPSLVEQSVGGTLGYTAPELLSPHAVPTPSADIYALGMLFWTLITGRPPEEYGPHDRQRNPGEVALSICHRCLQNEPTRRYESAQGFAEAIKSL